MSTYRLTPHEQVEVTGRTDAALTATVTYAPGGEPPPAHKHPAQDERFAILEGRLTVRLGGQKPRELGPGDTLEIPRGTAHAMWNPTGETVRATWETLPPMRTEEWWSTLDAITSAGRKLGPLTMAGPLLRYRDVFRLSR